jgi:hypothetical protein
MVLDPSNTFLLMRASWTGQLKHKFSLEESQKKSFFVILKALDNSGIRKTWFSNNTYSFILCWEESSPLHLVKSKTIYSLVTFDAPIPDHLNACWNLSLPRKDWMKILTNLWKTHIEPKIAYFLWRFLLHKLPFAKPSGEPNRCSICAQSESVKHVFFECPFAPEIWYMFGFVQGVNFSIDNIIFGKIYYSNSNLNVF